MTSLELLTETRFMVDNLRGALREQWDEYHGLSLSPVQTRVLDEWLDALVKRMDLIEERMDEEVRASLESPSYPQPATKDTWQLVETIANSLDLLTDYERGLIKGRVEARVKFGERAVITERQRRVIEGIGRRLGLRVDD